MIVAVGGVLVSVAVAVEVGVDVGVYVIVGKIIETKVNVGVALAKGVRVMLTFGTHRV